MANMRRAGAQASEWDSTGRVDEARLPLAGEHVPVSLQKVGFSYGGAPVLDGISLLLEPGEFAVVTGENGAGKSTLLRLVLGELAPTAGEVRLFGRDPLRFHDWTRVGYVPQRTVAAYGQFPANVEEVVSANLYSRARRFLPFGRNERARAREALNLVGMAGMGDRMLGELSGGQLQRVLLARALVGQPDLLVLDEPTSGLDAEAAAGFAELLRRLRGQDEHLAVLMVTHDLARLSGLGARVLRLEGGLLTETGTFGVSPLSPAAAPAGGGSRR